MSYTETQHFRDSIIFKVTLAVLAILTLVVYFKIFNAENKLAGMIFLASICLVLGLLWFYSIETKIDKEGIHYRVAYIIDKTIPWNEIVGAKVIDYGFVGGYGIRVTTTYGTVYNVAGRHGLFLRLGNNKKMIIGTQQPEELEKFMKNHKPEYT